MILTRFGTFASQGGEEFFIGDTGPGGGIIFFKDLAGFTSGPTGTDTYQYLECLTTDLGVAAWSGNTNTLVGTNSVIGSGYKNTVDAVAQNSTPARAITLCNSFTNNGLSDWFLPSQDELTQIFIQRGVIGGFVVNRRIWSSTETGAGSAFERIFPGGGLSSNSKTLVLGVRPIRGFSL